MPRDDNGNYKLSTERRMSILETKVDDIQKTVDSLEMKFDKINLTMNKWLGGGAVVLLLAQAVWAYILSRN